MSSKHWLIIFQLYVLLHPAMLCVALVVANSTLCCQTQIQAFRMPLVVLIATFFFCRSIIMTAVTYFVYDRDNIHKKKLASAEKAPNWTGPRIAMRTSSSFPEIPNPRFSAPTF